MQNMFRSAALMLGLIISGCDCQGTPPNNGTGGGGGSTNSDGGGGAGGNTGGGGTSGGGTGNMMSMDGGCGLVTCEKAGADCGPIGDGCGALISCGSCTLPQTCGGAGLPSACGGDAGCIPTTCQALGAECGPMADRCGNLLNCGSCALPEVCGGGGIPARCGLLGNNVNDGGVCVPTTCELAGAECGVIGDGCGNTIICGSCASGTTCGGGGAPYKCGGGTMCTPLTCLTANATCGSVGNGCGGILNCGTCTAPEVCGGGGTPSHCGGGVPCVPLTCAEQNATCGVVGNGCGGLTPSCGTCSGAQACGAGGVPNQCGGSVTCIPKDCTALGANCGPVGDGCGSIIMCGTCAVPGQTCGGGGMANQCGGPALCIPKTCGELGANCGPVNDGCGGLTTNCGSCNFPDICGGAGTPSVCGSIRPDAGPCTNLCTHQTSCTGMPDGTTLTGTVLAPTNPAEGYGQPDPIPGAYVYVPNGTVLPLTGDGGVTCDRCSDPVSGEPLVTTYSATNGSFTLKNVPCGAGVQVPVVFHLGKWRRQIMVDSPVCCQNTVLTAEQTRLPRKQGEFNPNDNIPKIAVVTGNVDIIECVLPKIGIAADQYSLPSGNGRVKFYRENGALFGGSSVPADTLFNDLNEMRKYDMIILDCKGGEHLKPIAQRNRMVQYANGGGRIFASHFAYSWLFDQALDPQGNRVANSNSFTGTAEWDVIDTYPGNQDARIDTGFPKGVSFAEWVQLVNAQAATSTTAIPRIRILTVRNDTNRIIAPAQRWVYGSIVRNGQMTTPEDIPLQYTFNTPTTVPAAEQCGRVLFSDFHVIDANNAGTKSWPDQCAGGPMTPQEKVFEYLIFDLSSCIAPDVPPVQMCTAKTCTDLGFTCGPAADGCGGTLNCGTCTLPATCGGGGVANQCGTPCTARTCTDLGANCGQQGDGCGGTLNCGTCTPPQTCGGGGTPNVCGGSACVPKTCAQLGYTCGQQSDGCGGIAQGPGGPNCGPCTPPQTCGGGGMTGVCGGGTCVPSTCVAQGFECGLQGDGCGGSLNCGPCTPPQTCGGGGQPGICGGGGTCAPSNCLMQGFNCGLQGDGCGAQIDCGPCLPGQVCGAQGPGLCGSTMCIPLTCDAQNIHCGPAGDGCGNVIQCGICPEGEVCGGAGVPGYCGKPPCTPRTCEQAGANCGELGDGCGGSIECGVCPPTETCGGGGMPNVCGGIG